LIAKTMDQDSLSDFDNPPLPPFWRQSTSSSILVLQHPSQAPQWHCFKCDPPSNSSSTSFCYILWLHHPKPTKYDWPPMLTNASLLFAQTQVLGLEIYPGILKIETGSAQLDTKECKYWYKDIYDEILFHAVHLALQTICTGAGTMVLDRPRFTKPPNLECNPWCPLSRVLQFVGSSCLWTFPTLLMLSKPAMRTSWHQFKLTHLCTVQYMIPPRTNKNNLALNQLSNLFEQPQVVEADLCSSQIGTQCGVHFGHATAFAALPPNSQYYDLQEAGGEAFHRLARKSCQLSPSNSIRWVAATQQVKEDLANLEHSKVLKDTDFIQHIGATNFAPPSHLSLTLPLIEHLFRCLGAHPHLAFLLVDTIPDPEAPDKKLYHSTINLWGLWKLQPDRTIPPV
jgi:hypothetical protein